MRLLLDMGLARSTAAFLRAQGYDAVHLREQGLQRLSDERWPSVITFRLNDMRAVQVNRHLPHVFDRYADDLDAGALISVRDDHIRVRRLPVG